MSSSLSNLLKTVAALWFAAFVLVFYLTTPHWRFENDASLIRYVVFFISKGFTPYRQIVDINLPGTYLLDWLTLHLFGSGVLGLRIYDGLLLAISGLSMALIMPRKQYWAGICAACLFSLFHARDGALELGQRDLAMAALLLASIAQLVLLTRPQQNSSSPSKDIRWPLPVLFGLTIGLATAIKPVCLLFALLLIPCLPAFAPGKRLRLTLYAAAGLLLPWIAILLYLLHEQALHDFLQIMTLAIPFHARLAMPGIASLCKSFLTSSLWVFAALSLLAAILIRHRTLEEKLTLYGMLVGALCYFLQFRGYTYHRYPFIGCLILFSTLGILRLLAHPGYTRALGLAAAIFTIVLCPLYAKQARRTVSPEAMTLALQSDLQALGGKPAFDHSIQCIDTIYGCLRTLYDLRLTQTTGTLYDEFLFHNNLPAPLEDRRTAFLSELKTHPPQILVVTPPLFPSGPPDYSKLSSWPAFNQLLTSCYRLEQDRLFPTELRVTPGYRLYRLLPQCVAQSTKTPS